MEEKIMIRESVKDDIKSINSLDKESADYHKKFDKDFFSISEKLWKIKTDTQIKAMENKNELILVAELEKEIVGYIWGYIEKCQINNKKDYKIGKIQELVVTSKQRRKSVGIKLISEMLKFFRRKNCTISEIEVFVENEPAIKTYQKAGYGKKEYKMQIILDKVRKFKPFS